MWVRVKGTGDENRPSHAEPARVESVPVSDIGVVPRVVAFAIPRPSSCCPPRPDTWRRTCRDCTRQQDRRVRVQLLARPHRGPDVARARRAVHRRDASGAPLHPPNSAQHRHPRAAPVATAASSGLVRAAVDAVEHDEHRRVEGSEAARGMSPAPLGLSTSAGGGGNRGAARRRKRPDCEPPANAPPSESPPSKRALTSQSRPITPPSSHVTSWRSYSRKMVRPRAYPRRVCA